MPQEREPATSVIQGRLLKMIDATKRMSKEDAIWLIEHATHKDLRALADKIEEVATAPAKK
jgi:hypothetical protein